MKGMTTLQIALNGTWIKDFASGTSARRNPGNNVAMRMTLALVLCWIGATMSPPAARAQNVSVVTTIRMTVEAGHEMVSIPCRVNGSERRYTCVIDSGATYTVISDRVVKPEGPPIDMTTGNGVVRVHQREVSLTLADGMELKSKALVQQKMLQGVDILVGQDVLRQFKYVTFDYENRKVEFQR
jgi:hypothetical protein